jgi:hypothetical protein
MMMMMMMMMIEKTTEVVDFMHGKFAYNIFQRKWAIVRQYTYQNTQRRITAL